MYLRNLQQGDQRTRKKLRASIGVEQRFFGVIAAAESQEAPASLHVLLFLTSLLSAAVRTKTLSQCSDLRKKLSIVKSVCFSVKSKMSFNLCNDDDAMDTSSPRRSTSGEDDTDTTFVDEYNAWRQTDRQSIKLRGVNFIC